MIRALLAGCLAMLALASACGGASDGEPAARSGAAEATLTPTPTLRAAALSAPNPSPTLPDAVSTAGWVEFDGTGYRAARDPSWDLELVRARLHEEMEPIVERLEAMFAAVGLTEESSEGEPTAEQLAVLESDEFGELYLQLTALQQYPLDERLNVGGAETDPNIDTQRVCIEGQSLRPETTTRFMRDVALADRVFTERAAVIIAGNEYVVFEHEAESSLGRASVQSVVVPGPSGCWVFFEAKALGDYDIEREFRAFLSTVHDME